MTQEQDAIRIDLMHHLRAKISRALLDHIDTCERIKMPKETIFLSATTVLLDILAHYFLASDTSPQEFAKMCLEVARMSKKEAEQGGG